MPGAVVEIQVLREALSKPRVAPVVADEDTTLMGNGRSLYVMVERVALGIQAR
jgi:hypothetical protein